MQDNQTKKKLKILGVPSSIKLSQKGVSCTNGFVCEHLKRFEVIEDLISPEISLLENSYILMKSFSFNKYEWLFKNRTSIDRSVLKTKDLSNKIKYLDVGNINSVLQVGSEFDICRLVENLNVPHFSYHDNNILAFLKSRHRLKKSFINKHVGKIINREKKIYDRLHGIFTMTHYLKDIFVKDFCLPEDKVHVIGVGCNMTIDKFTTKNYSSKNIIFVAKDSFSEKGGYDLLEAFKLVRSEIPGATLKIVGQNINISEEGVEIIGFLDKTTEYGSSLIKDIYRNASLFVMPSYVEATGNVFLEAMAHGVPCVGANVSAMPELIVGNECGFVVEPGDTNALGQVIIDMLRDESMLERFGGNGVSAINKKYNWDVVCNNAISIMMKYI